MVENKKNFYPMGMAINNTVLYVCDQKNNCVLLLDKENGIYQMEWGSEGKLDGQFYEPFCIFIYKGITYIGDSYSVQLFNKDGICFERIETYEK